MVATSKNKSVKLATKWTASLLVVVEFLIKLGHSTFLLNVLHVLTDRLEIHVPPPPIWFTGMLPSGHHWQLMFTLCQLRMHVLQFATDGHVTYWRAHIPSKGFLPSYHFHVEQLSCLTNGPVGKPLLQLWLSAQYPQDFLTSERQAWQPMSWLQPSLHMVMFKIFMSSGWPHQPSSPSKFLL